MLTIKVAATEKNRTPGWELRVFKWMRDFAASLWPFYGELQHSLKCGAFWQTLLQVRKEQQLSTFGLLKENATFLLELRGTTSLELEMPTYINVF